MKLHRKMALILAILTLTFTTGCSSDNADTPLSGTTTAGDETQESKEPSYIDLLPEEVYYPDTTFHIGYTGCYDNPNESDYTLEEAEGDVINEAIYLRNLRVEEKLGITITAEQMCNEWTEMMSTLQLLVQTGDCPYDVIDGPIHWQFKSSLNNLLIDMSTLDSIDFTHEWWDTDVIRDMYSLGTENIYYASGDINYFDEYALQCLIFNKKICDTYNLEYPYQLVLDGKWTNDKLMEYCKNFGIDLNGDSVMDENDLFGYINNYGALNVFLSAAGENIILVNDDGSVTLNQGDRLLNAVNTFFDDYASNPEVVCIMERKLGYEVGLQVFPSGHALFAGNALVLLIADYRLSMEDDFGILPHPKLDESQENYSSGLNTAYATGYSIPITNTDPERSGWILDVMGYYSQDTIYPAVIEKNIKTKAMRDEESIAMLDIIFQNKFYELGAWGTTVYDRIMGLVGSNRNTYASMLEKVRKTTNKEFAELPNTYNFVD